MYKLHRSACDTNELKKFCEKNHLDYHGGLLLWHLHNKPSVENDEVAVTQPAELLMNAQSAPAHFTHTGSSLVFTSPLTTVS